MNDGAKEEPGKFNELKAEWEAYAKAVGYIEAGEIKQLGPWGLNDGSSVPFCHRTLALARRASGKVLCLRRSSFHLK